MPRPPLDGIGLLLIDGSNLLHRVAGGADPGAQRTLVPKLRAALPPTLATVMMLDGHADSGMARRERVGKGFEIRHSGSMSADDALIRLVDDYPPSGRHEVTVVSDDRALADRARSLGARTQRLAWLEQLIETRSTHRTSIGAGKPPAQKPAPDGSERRPWQPGRGATRKTGNPKRRRR
jgi:hypothetical protein